MREGDGRPRVSIQKPHIAAIRHAKNEGVVCERSAVSISALSTMCGLHNNSNSKHTYTPTENYNLMDNDTSIWNEWQRIDDDKRCRNGFLQILPWPAAISKYTHIFEVICSVTGCIQLKQVRMLDASNFRWVRACALLLQQLLFFSCDVPPIARMLACMLLPPGAAVIQHYTSPLGFIIIITAIHTDREACNAVHMHHGDTSRTRA